MRGEIGQIILFAVAMSAATEAGAMKIRADQAGRIVGGEKLLAGAGGRPRCAAK